MVHLCLSQREEISSLDICPFEPKLLKKRATFRNRQGHLTIVLVLFSGSTTKQAYCCVSTSQFLQHAITPPFMLLTKNFLFYYEKGMKRVGVYVRWGQSPSTAYTLNNFITSSKTGKNITEPLNFLYIRKD